MTQRELGLNDADRVQTDANLRLAVQFIPEYLEDPERFGDIPTGGSLVLLPPDDPALSATNRAMAEALMAEGRHVRLVHVGAAVSGSGVDEATPHRLAQ